MTAAISALSWQGLLMAKKVERPLVPEGWVRRIGDPLLLLPEVVEEAAWVGIRWRVRGATIAHVFGGEDQLFRITARGDPDEVAAFQHLGDPYFRGGWGENLIGMVLSADSDWDEVIELVTDSYCLQAPPTLAAQVVRPQPPA